MTALPNAAPLWSHQADGVMNVIHSINRGQRRIVLTSPTGGGKTRMMAELIRWAVNRGMRVILYTNRKLLLKQLARELSRFGIAHGIRASGHEPDPSAVVQVSSIQTEWSRVYQARSWPFFRADLVLIDEVHLQKGGTAVRIMNDHEETNGGMVGITATPLDLGGLYTEMVQAGTNSELRACGALVPALIYGPDEPDLRHVGRQKTGEFMKDGVVKAIMTPSIFGRVADNWRRLNEGQGMTLGFAPGVAESIGLAEHLTRDFGITCGHIDGSGVWWGGKTYHADEARDDLIAAFNAGDVQILWNRFVLREGIDLPQVRHLVFATAFGSLQSFLQSGGRGLRAATGKVRCMVQDHGGNWHRHGSLNADRHWRLGMTADGEAKEREVKLKAKANGETEPIVCPQCSCVRGGGAQCPKCGYRHTASVRTVIQADGTLKKMTGDVYREDRVEQKPESEKHWTAVYWRCRKAKQPKTFNQAFGFFIHTHHYRPPRNLPLMPIDEADWPRKIIDVPFDKLYKGTPRTERQKRFV